MSDWVMDLYNQALSYSVNPIVFVVLYLVSFVPFYYGVYMMGQGVLRGDRVRLGLGFSINRLSWAIPYLYVIAFGHHLPVIFYLLVGLWLVLAVSYSLTKRGRRGLTRTGNRLAHLWLRLAPPTYRLVRPSELEKALKLEYKVFRSLGFCESSKQNRIEEYVKYLRQSRFYVAVRGRRIIGVLRLISNGPLLPPFRSEFALDSTHADMIESRTTEEVGIVAVATGLLGNELGKELYRVAWTDAKQRGITAWAAVTEEWLWRYFNKRYHFTFFQCGAERDYMGGSCYPLLMSFTSVEQNMSHGDPELYRWFTASVPASLLAVDPAAQPAPTPAPSQ